MINPKQLLNDLKRVLRDLEDDIRERAGADTDLDASLRREHAEARKAERTATTFNAWRDEQVTQSAVAWILGCVFVRFLEDNELIKKVWISGSGERLQLARDQEMLFYRESPTASERDYLERVFDESAKLPTLEKLFDESHNPLWRLPLSGDGARELLDFFRKTDPDTGDLLHNFTDPEWDTRFLGDLYQDLSEAARKKYALLQTPEFVEEFILERTLIPAIETFGLREVRLIDPTCGSAHFLIGAFREILGRWIEIEPGTNIRDLVQRSLDAVYGVDINPFAVAIARFRLLVEALRVCDIRKLEHALAFRFNLAVGDSLLHGVERQHYMPGFEDQDPIGFVYETEDSDELRRILKRRFHAVVGNPPYITVKDKALNQAYRDRYGSCHGKYSLAVPFMERFFGLAVAKSGDAPAGLVGMITANSFMKREFGKKLIQEYIPQWDLTHVIDTSGAYIPGHNGHKGGTPTCVLFGGNQSPVKEVIRAVMSIRGEPGTPSHPKKGKVWSAILNQIDEPSSESDYISVDDVPRERFYHHPWSLQGGGAAETLEIIKASASYEVDAKITVIGFTAITGEDEIYVGSRVGPFRRRGINESDLRPFGIGESVRDFCCESDLECLFPYSSEFSWEISESTLRYLWPFKTLLNATLYFGKDKSERGMHWSEYVILLKNKLKSPTSITLAFVATHNHFVFDGEGKIFKQSAPVMKLPEEATELDHLFLLGLLNSSVACFWGRQTLFPKGGFASGKWEERLEWDGSKLRHFPVVVAMPIALPRKLNRFGKELNKTRPNAIVSKWHAGSRNSRTKGSLVQCLKEAHEEFWHIRASMISLQEELDWVCYRPYGLITEEASDALKCGNYECISLPQVNLGERAFEIVMARKMAGGELETTWFERHGSTPVTKIPDRWPDEYKKVVENRIAEIENNKSIRLIEKPEYKRRWQMDPWDKQVEKALYKWLANRLEYILSGRDLMKEATASEQISNEGGGDNGAQVEEKHQTPNKEPELLSCAQLADRLKTDAEFQEVAALYTEQPGFDVTKLVTKLVEAEGVPNLPRFRYKPSGLRKRADWESVWDLQRREDDLNARKAQLTKKLEESEGDEELQVIEELKEVKRILAELDIPVPPKYKSADFKKSTYWRLRGKLDVPKERFIVYAGCEREGDSTLVLT